MGRNFKPNPAALTQLRADPAYQRLVRRRANDALTAAEHAAPIGETQDYIHSLSIVEVRGRSYLSSNDFAAHLVEYGSANNPAYAPLRRGVRAAGLDLREDPKQ